LYEFHELWAAECSDDQRVSLASAVCGGSCIAKVAAKARRKAKTVEAACRGEIPAVPAWVSTPRIISVVVLRRAIFSPVGRRD